MKFSSQLVEFALGVIIVLFVMFVEIVGGGVCGGFIHMPSLVMTLGLMVGLTVASNGSSRIKKTLLLITTWHRPQPSQDILHDTCIVIKSMIYNLYVGGIVATVFGIIQSLLAIPHLVEEKHLSHFGISLGLSLLGSLYAISGAELFLRPIVVRLDSMLENGALTLEGAEGTGEGQRGQEQPTRLIGGGSESRGAKGGEGSALEIELNKQDR